MTEKIENVSRKIKTLLALAGDVWLSEEDIVGKFKDDKISRAKVSNALQHLYNESEIVTYKNKYTINCHQYM